MPKLTIASRTDALDTAAYTVGIVIAYGTDCMHDAGKIVEPFC